MGLLTKYRSYNERKRYEQEVLKRQRTMPHGEMFAQLVAHRRQTEEGAKIKSAQLEQAEALKTMKMTAKAAFMNHPAATEWDFERCWPNIRDDFFLRSTFRALETNAEFHPRSSASTNGAGNSAHRFQASSVKSDTSTEMKSGELLQWNEAMEVLKAVENPTTEQLMCMATIEVMKRLQVEDDMPPIADFNLRFFMEVMRDFCSDHDNLRKVLDGQDLRMLTEEDGSDE